MSRCYSVLYVMHICKLNFREDIDPVLPVAHNSFPLLYEARLDTLAISLY